MPAYIALLRAVNVGGTGKLPMSELKAFCEELGFVCVLSPRRSDGCDAARRPRACR
jgi:hypothetical protein